jgi:hypothetical protein
MRETAGRKGGIRKLPEQPVICLCRGNQNKLYRCANGNFSAGAQTNATPSAFTS